MASPTTTPPNRWARTPTRISRSTPFPAGRTPISASTKGPSSCRRANRSTTRAAFRNPLRHRHLRADPAAEGRRVLRARRRAGRAVKKVPDYNAPSQYYEFARPCGRALRPDSAPRDLGCSMRLPLLFLLLFPFFAGKTRSPGITTGATRGSRVVGYLRCRAYFGSGGQVFGLLRCRGCAHGRCDGACRARCRCPVQSGQ